MTRMKFAQTEKQADKGVMVEMDWIACGIPIPFHDPREVQCQGRLENRPCRI